MQFCTIAEYGPWRWFNIWNLQDSLAFVLQVLQPLHPVLHFHSAL